jgi:hypothetical protein
MTTRYEGRSEPALPSGPLRRVLDALLDGRAATPADQDALTPDERAEVAAAVRAAHLTRVVLHQESPAEAAEAASLERSLAAQKVRPANRHALPGETTHPWSALQDWFRKLRGQN